MQVPETVTLRSWLGWLLYEDARNSHRAYEIANKPDAEWAKLPSNVQHAMEWAREDEVTGEE